MLQEAKIEIVRIHRLENGGSVKAFCDVQFGEDYVVKGFKVVESADGLFVGMPSEPGKNGKWYNTFVPLSNEAKDCLTGAIMKAYEE